MSLFPLDKADILSQQRGESLVLFTDLTSSQGSVEVSLMPLTGTLFS